MSESAFSFLFSEFISYEKRRVSSSTDLEQRQVILLFSNFSRMDQCGFDVGYKLLEVLYAKLRPGKRPTQVREVLQFISSPCWKYLFGREADSLECRADNPNEFIITDYAPLCSKYISVPKVMVDLFAQL